MLDVFKSKKRLQKEKYERNLKHINSEHIVSSYYFSLLSTQQTLEEIRHQGQSMLNWALHMKRLNSKKIHVPHDTLGNITLHIQDDRQLIVQDNNINFN